jgi:RNA polymerase sigma factor (sigma-70 family)
MTDRDAVHFLSFKKGETKGQEYYFLRYWPSVRSYAASFLKKFGIAADVADDCFAKAREMRERFKDEEHLRRFLFFMARIHSLRYLRGDRYPYVVEVGREERQVEDAVAEEEREEQRTKMLEIIDELPYKRRLALWYRYYKGWTPKTIAIFLGVAEQTVRNNINKGKEQARKRWNKSA